MRKGDIPNEVVVQKIEIVNQSQIHITGETTLVLTPPETVRDVYSLARSIHNGEQIYMFFITMI